MQGCYGIILGVEQLADQDKDHGLSLDELLKAREAISKEGGRCELVVVEPDRGYIAMICWGDRKSKADIFKLL